MQLWPEPDIPVMLTDSYRLLPRSKSADRPSRSSTPNSRGVLRLRMLAAQTEWLDGPLRWVDGRVEWTHSRGTLAPSAADLSAAQRALYQVARYPHAGDRAFGDGRQWLAARQARLEEAKRLRAIHAPDLPLLLLERSTGALHRLVELLCTEALCVNDLPASPAQALVRAAMGAPGPATTLKEMIGDEAAPRAGRALAALVLGVIARKSEWLHSDAWLARAYTWGARRGLPREPGLAVALLSHDGGPQLLQRWQRTQSAESELLLPVESLRTMLHAGVESERVVALCESMAQLEPLTARFKSAVMGELDSVAARFEIPAPRLHSWREELRDYSVRGGAALAAVACDFALSTQNPQAPRLLGAFVNRMLDMQPALSSYLVGTPDKKHQQRRARNSELQLSASGRPFLPRRDATASVRTTQSLWEFALRALKGGQSLPPDLRVPYLRLLVDEGARLWDAQGLDWGSRNRTPPERAAHLRVWLRERWTEGGQPLTFLLKRSRDPDLCRQALHAGVHGALGRCRFRDPALYAYALHLIEALQMSGEWRLNQLCEAVGHFGTLSEARAALGPVADAVGVLPSGSRSEAFDEVLNAVGSTRKGLQSDLPRLAPHLKSLFAFLTHAERDDDLYNSIQALIALDAALRPTMRREADFHPDLAANADDADANAHVEAEAGVVEDDVPVAPALDAPALDEWLRWLLDETQSVQQERETAQRQEWFSIGLTTRTCALLAEGDFERFQHGFRALARFDIENTENLERGLDALRRYPMLHAPLTEHLAARPARTLKLLSHLGLTARLSADALHPLEVWKPQPCAESAAVPHEDLPQDWQNVLVSFPQLAPLSADYVWSQRVRAESLDVPASVRRALELPQKLQGELAHLEPLAQAHPERPGLLQRAMTLRARLAESATLWAQSEAEARDKLHTLTREARLKAAERSVENCFRAQLQTLVGRLPQAMALDDNWFNAVLLSVDIAHNRKVLRHLLRAQASGDLTWRERQMGNQTFLHEMAARGGNVEAWMGEHRKRYRCAELPGERVHLRLERDPLQVLQMGNAFGTCLSAGDINAFSTVANACEANKRVLFARDGQNRIVARKLLALNADGALVGFHTYTSGPNEAANTALRRIVHRYAQEFAARCELALAEAGEVPLLFAEEWYDDGIVLWSDAHAKPPASKADAAKAVEGRSVKGRKPVRLSAENTP